MKFTAETTSKIVDCVGSGGTLTDAAREGGVTLRTLKGWLAKGRKDSGSDFAPFAAAVDAARSEAAAQVEPGDYGDLKREVWKAVAKGSVQAMKLYEEILRGEDEEDEEPAADPLDRLDGETDELARRRAQAA